MTTSTFDANARAAADRYFNLNFTAGRYGTSGLSMDYVVGNDMIVHGAAAVTVPTVIMSIFGKRTIPLAATCEAQLQLPNSDIMFVLDTTLSMAETNPGDTISKIQALRQSVATFYNTLNNAQTSAAQVRYGFVPYSSTVNVGLLLKPEWMVDNWTYQSREQDGYADVSAGTQGSTITTNGSSTYTGSKTSSTQPGPSENCVAPPNEGYSSTPSYTPWDPSSTALPRSRTVTVIQNGSTYSALRNSSTGICTITKTTFSNYTQTYSQTVSANPNANASNGTNRVYYWNYRPISYSMAPFKTIGPTGLIAGGSMSTTLGNNFTSKVINWGNSNQGACIEERTTVRSGMTGIEYDLDVDLVPSANMPDTQWRPFLPDLVWSRSVGNYYPGGTTAISGWQINDVNHSSSNYISPGQYKSDFAACPSAARKLAAIRTTAEQTNLTTYLNALVPRGRTYHDVGMLWGLRLMSAQGLFATENASAANGGAITRNLIFMTDGDTETNIADYDAYGLSALDRRRTSSSSLPTNFDQDTIVENRLRRLCTLAKDQKNITVWVIAFGTSLTSLLTDCASPNRAYQANNTAELNQTFADIAARISQLRVTH